MKIVVIGSGLAGLTAALTLARRKQDVLLLEQNEFLGGVTSGFEKDGFRWDYGQLNLEAAGEDEPVGQVLELLGLRKLLQIVPEQRDYIFPDFEIRTPAEYGGVKWRIEYLKQLFPAEAEGLERYWADYVRFTRLMTLARHMEKGGLGAKAAFYASLLPLISKKDWTAEKLLAHYFTDEKLKAVFVSILADFFTPPSQFQGLGVFAINAERAYERRMPAQLARNAEMLGLYAVAGGMKELIRIYEVAIKAAGVSVRCNTAVTRIVVENNQVSGVVDQNGKLYPCDCVVASGGAKETFFNLLDPAVLPEDFAARVKDIPLMDSVFMLHLGVDEAYPEVLRSTSTYFYGSYDIEGQVKQAQEGIYHEGKAGFVVHLPSLRSPAMAPKGKYAMTIYTICPEKLKSGNWEKNKEKYAAKLLDYAEKYLPGLRKHILTQVIVTPLDLRRITHLQHHAFGGIAPLLNSWRVPHQTPVQGLWFIGAQSESGGGMNAVIPASFKVAQKIADSQRR